MLLLQDESNDTIAIAVQNNFSKTLWIEIDCSNSKNAVSNRYNFL
jgi:hypothetical protein